MKENNLTISIAHMYPKLLNLNGDIGNIITLQNRCLWRGINVEFEEINIGDKIKNHDIYFIGSGQDKQQKDVANELLKNKAEFRAQQKDGAVFLGICGGYQLLGNYYKLENDIEIKCLSLLDTYSINNTKRFTGNVTVETDFLTPNQLVGFENHNSITYIQGETKPLAKIIIGNGNNGRDLTEGARYKNIFGTNLHGPLLPKNVHFADYLIELALEKRYGEKIKLSKLDDKFEQMTHNMLVNKEY
ncbi:MAG: glutamine amidotransferase [Cyanobacteria bacterium SIG26]|nr:glutamine amidotransferase [Cyanobacteria bacterium SIG26]